MPDIFKSPKPQTKIPESTVEILKSPKRAAFIHRLPGHTHNALCSFCYFPDKLKFVAKDSKEETVLFLRRHPITNLSWALIAIVFLLAPAALKFFPILSFLPANFQLIAVCIWYLVTIAFALEKFIDWFFNVCVVTDERIFDVDFVNLIYREISEANLDQIQDVTVKMGGVIRTLFNYGDVFIQTAGEIPRVEFEDVANPDRVAKILRELRVEEEQEKIEGRVR